MSPENQQPNSENASAELAFVQRALADRRQVRAHLSRHRWRRSPFWRSSSLSGCTIASFPADNLGELLHAIIHLALFFLVLLFAITMYLRQVIINNTRTILRAIANTRSR